MKNFCLIYFRTIPTIPSIIPKIPIFLLIKKSNNRPITIPIGIPTRFPANNPTNRTYITKRFGEIPEIVNQLKKLTCIKYKIKNIKIIPLSVDVESEIALLNDEDKDIFLKEYQLEKSGLDILIRESFNKLGLATYFTVGIKETRAWVFKQKMLAPQCAAIIHNDFEKYFIKAEVISYQDFIQCGGEKEARDMGKLRLEGKTYEMQDGDICNFKIGK